MEAIDEFVTPDEAAALLEVTRDRIDVLVSEGLLQPIAVETEVWFHRAEVEAAPVAGRLTSHSLVASERSAEQLDDELDRDELRQRYYGLLQELRVLLPGVQVLVAFLLTAPFAQRFTDLDSLGRTIFGVSLVSGLVAVVAFVTPTAFHRLGVRTSRSERLIWAIRMTRVGIGFMALSLVSALFVVCRLIYGTPTAVVTAAAAGSGIPRRQGVRHDGPVPRAADFAASPPSRVSAT